MAINKITDLEFRNLKPTDKVQTLSDGAGLMVRVRAIEDGGAISLMYSYRVNGKQCRITLESTTLKKARIERATYEALVKQGLDPRIERKLKVERLKQAQIVEQEALAKIAARTTVNGLFVRWCDTDIFDRKDITEIKRMFGKDVLPVIGMMFVEDVRKSHITQVTDILKKRGVGHLARNLLKLMRQMFRFAVDRGVIDYDPTGSLNIVKITTKPTERDRVLSNAEITELADKIPDAGLLRSTECGVWIALSTMCRIGELSKAKLSDVDFESKVWIIPAENSKNGKPHTVYLSDFALKEFLELKRLTTSDTWFFPNRADSGHVCEKSITKQLGSRQTSNVLSHRTGANQSLILSGGKWTPHDLRRTGATMMGELGIKPDVIEKCLNHTEENKIKRIYQRQKLEFEQAEAWRLLADRIYLLRNFDHSNVVLFERKSVA